MKKMCSRMLCCLMTLAMVFCLTSLSSLAAEAGEWNSYRGNGRNNGVVDVRTARTAQEASLKWELALKASDDWNTAISDPVQAQGNLYVAVGSELLRINALGEVTGRGQMEGAIGYTCRLLAAEGKVIVPLSDGRLQCLDGESLQLLWTTDPVVTAGQDGQQQNHQALTTLTYEDGLLYGGTAYADWSQSYSGVYQCVDVESGEVVWQYENHQAGYYWSGAVCVGGAVLFAGDDGIVTSLNAKTGAVIDQMDVGSSVRSTLVLEGREIFFSSSDGILHKVAVAADGTLSQHQSVSFANSSTGTPAVSGGKVYVGGAMGADHQYAGVLAVVDAATMQVEQTVTAPADVKSAPLVTTAYEDEVYVYYTSNTTPGALYVLKAGDEEGQVLFTPTGDGQNYCMTSVMADQEGTLYYTNDSGKLFAVASSVPEEGGDNSSQGGGQSQDPGTDESSEGSSAGGSSSHSSNTVHNPPTGESDIAFVAAGGSALLLAAAWAIWKRRQEA